MSVRRCVRASILLLVCAGPAGGAERRVALTFDDLPGVTRFGTLDTLREMNAATLAALTAARAPAIGFVTERALHVRGERDARVAILESWLDAGMLLGNHGFAHRGLTATPLAEFEDDVLRGEVVTRALLAARGMEPVYFRFPYTQTGPTAEIRRACAEFLAARRYRVAPFTVEDADYAFAAIYEAALERDDAETARRARDGLVRHRERMFEWFEALARETFGREIPQVLLLHVNRLNATLLAESLERLERRGYRFVTLDDALADPAFRTADGYFGAHGPSWLHRWRAGLGLPDRVRDEPDPPAWVLDAYAAIAEGH